MMLSHRVARIVAQRYMEAATAQGIKRGLSPAVQERSAPLQPRLTRSSDSVSVYAVSDYTVRVQETGGDLRLSCTCDFWKYQGPEYHAVQGDYLLGEPQGSATEPIVRDPQGRNRLCKHVVAVLDLRESES